MFPVSGHFLLSRTSFALLCNILTGAMVLVNGGLIILPHVCDDLWSVRVDIGELLFEDSKHSVKKTGKLGPREECNTSSRG